MEKATFRTEVLKATLQATKEFASKDSRRPNLARLCVEIGEAANKVKVTATDGHTLCHVVVDSIDCTLKNSGTRYELTPEDIDVLLARCKAKDATVTVEFREEQTTYPPYEQVIPAKITSRSDDGRPDYAAIGFNADYLARIGKVQRALSAKCARLQLGEKDLDPMRVDIEGSDCTQAIVVLMPMRI
jgi:hypothetical protein